MPDLCRSSVSMTDLRHAPGLNWAKQCSPALLDGAACGGVRGLQQVRRSRSSSRIDGRVQRRVHAAKEFIHSYGFEAECKALRLGAIGPVCKPKSFQKLTASLQASAKTDQPSAPEVAPSPSPSESITLYEPRTFRQYYQQHFKENALCQGAMDSIYKSMVSEAPAASSEAEKLDTNGDKALGHTVTVKPVHTVVMRIKPSVGTWMTPRFKLNRAAAAQVQLSEDKPIEEPTLDDPTPDPKAETDSSFRIYYAQHFTSNTISSNVMEGLYASMRLDSGTLAKPPADEHPAQSTSNAASASTHSDSTIEKAAMPERPAHFSAKASVGSWRLPLRIRPQQAARHQ